MQTVFYSWQIDCPNSTNRGFIEDCLERAIKEQNAQGSLQVEAAIDRDTWDVPGSPNIAETIFDKIDDCGMFLADVSFINGAESPSDPRCGCTRLTPNPNVLIECGYAVKSISFDRVVLVLNTATGPVEKLPFDLRGRRVLKYELRKGDDKAEARRSLVNQLKQSVQDIMKIRRTTFSLEFGDPKRRVPVGSEVTIAGTFIELKGMKYEDIPDYGRSVSGTQTVQIGSTKIEIPRLDFGVNSLSNNSEYFREAFLHVFFTSLLKPIHLILTNNGSKTVENVRAVLRIDMDRGAAMDELEFSKYRNPPKTQNDIYGRGGFPNIATAMRIHGTEVEKLDTHFLVTCTFNRLHPGESDFASVFYFGGKAFEVSISGKIFADDTPPQEVMLTVHYDMDQKSMTLDELVDSLPAEPKQEDDEI